MIRRLEVRAEDSLILRLWYASASRPSFQGAPVQNLSLIPVEVVRDLAPAMLRVVADEWTGEVSLNPPPEAEKLFRYAGGWWLRLEDAGNLHAMLEDAADARAIDGAAAEAVFTVPLPWKVFERELGIDEKDG